ncbi:MAG: hypothetical protein Q9174_002374 [Haloplaca sp. 1 TL-2023]
MMLINPKISRQGTSAGPVGAPHGPTSQKNIFNLREAMAINDINRENDEDRTAELMLEVRREKVMQELEKGVTGTVNAFVEEKFTRTHEIHALIHFCHDKDFRNDYNKIERHMLEVWRAVQMRDIENGVSPPKTRPISASQVESLISTSETIRDSMVWKVKESLERDTEEARNDRLRNRFNKLINEDCPGIKNQAVVLQKRYNQYKELGVDHDRRTPKGDGVLSRFIRDMPFLNEKAGSVDLEALTQGTNHANIHPKVWQKICPDCHYRAVFKNDQRVPCGADCCDQCWGRAVIFERGAAALTMLAQIILAAIIMFGFFWLRHRELRQKVGEAKQL